MRYGIPHTCPFIAQENCDHDGEGGGGAGVS